MKDYHKILGVNRDATEKEIKEAWKLKIVAYHPDKFKGKLREQAEEQSKLINEAYQVLSDPIKRHDYNRKLQTEKVQDFYEPFQEEKIRKRKTPKRGRFNKEKFYSGVKKQQIFIF